MAEEQKNGLTEALETGASAAHLARGAIKAGKAVSGAAKGAAAEGSCQPPLSCYCSRYFLC